MEAFVTRPDVSVQFSRTRTTTPSSVTVAVTFRGSPSPSAAGGVWSIVGAAMSSISNVPWAELQSPLVSVAQIRTAWTPTSV